MSHPLSIKTTRSRISGEFQESFRRVLGEFWESFKLTIFPTSGKSKAKGAARECDSLMKGKRQEIKLCPHWTHCEEVQGLLSGYSIAQFRG